MKKKETEEKQVKLDEVESILDKLLKHTRKENDGIGSIIFIGFDELLELLQSKEITYLEKSSKKNRYYNISGTMWVLINVGPFFYKVISLEDVDKLKRFTFRYDGKKNVTTQLRVKEKGKRVTTCMEKVILLYDKYNGSIKAIIANKIVVHHKVLRAFAMFDFLVACKDCNEHSYLHSKSEADTRNHRIEISSIGDFKVLVNAISEIEEMLKSDNCLFI